MAEATYFVYGLGLSVNQPLPRLAGVGAAGHVDVELTLGSMPQWRDQLVASSSEIWQVRQHPAASEPWLIVWKVGPDHIRLAYPDGLDVLLTNTGTRIWAVWPDALTLDKVSAYLLGPVLGIVLRLRGTTCLHASGIDLWGRGALFVGAQGAGKSTTAAALLARGHRVIADDIVPFTRDGGNWLVQPGYPCLRLWHDAINSLAPADPFFSALPSAPADDSYHVSLAGRDDRFQPDPLPLGAIYVLEDRSDDEQAPLVTPMTPASALMKLVGHTFANTYLDAAGRAGEFDTLASIAASVPIREVRAHTDPARIGRLCDLLLEDFSRGSSTLPVTDARRRAI